MSNANLILVADDNETSRYNKVRILRNAGFEVIETTNGTDTLQLAAARQPRLILLDVQMPGINGWEVCKRLKANPETASVLVLQVSATYVREEDTVRALDGGADACLTEPLEPPVLIATVRALLRARRAEDALRDALAREQSARTLAESANRMKDEFLATLSHELRSPLNAILTWASLLRSGRVDDKKREQGLLVIERNTRQQAQLIEDLLDVSRIISGKMRIELVPVDLTGAVTAAVDAQRLSADAKQIRVDVRLDRDVPLVSGDPSRVQQIISNLLSNAIKFTSAKGSVQVTLTQDGAAAQVQVADSGRGIDPGFLPHIFERFRQEDSTSTRAEGGLGLGLALVRHLAELHSGTVTAQSDGAGKGATFTVRIPLRVPRMQKATVHAGNAGPHTSSLNGMRILVVDDDGDARGAIAEALKLAGATVASEANVRDGLRIFDGGAIDIVVSDIAMPIEDGYFFIRELRSRQQDEPRTPVLALTAYAGAEEQQRVMAAGFDAYLAKPVDSRELAATLRRLVHRPLN